ncbi:tspO/MBR family protein [Asticcacaulis biprosthecium C19]|uniref:TspO/MBR family protein n=1 Tax=Asticcacaulis biprosthecium C19 TaxID=715226 RepID=F4QNR4_9CAUL|nr:tspO/MBR family protein [Asticcacaulis biprosthecium C19]
MALIVAAVVVLSAAVIGNLATFSGLVPWYASLNKPAFTPPNWLFGPVWSLLYLTMIFAFWRILTRPRATEGRGAAIAWFVVQMVLNGAWSVAFFGLQSPLLGLITIAALVVALVATILTSLKVDRIAGLMLLPYLAWVSFASLLNGAVWWLNR